MDALNEAQGEFNDFFKNEVKDPSEEVLEASTSVWPMH